MAAPNLGASVAGGNNFQLNASLAAAQQQTAGLQTMGVQHPSMSPSLAQQVAMSPPIGTQAQALTQRPPQQPGMMHMSSPQSLPAPQPIQQQQQQLQASPIQPGMQQSQQAMMLATVQAAGLSGPAAQALIAQITANAESNQQQQQQLAMPADGSSNAVASPVSNSSANPASKPANMTPERAQQPVSGGLSPAASNASVGGSSITPTTPSSSAQRPSQPVPVIQGRQVHPRPNRPMRPVIRAQGARPPATGARKPGTPTTPRPGMRPLTPVNTQQGLRPPPVSSNGSAKGGSTPAPSTPVSRATTPNSAASKIGGAVRAHPPIQPSLAVSGTTTPMSVQATSGTSTPGSHSIQDSVTPSAATESLANEESTASPK
ncbi:hypothetical protein IWW45_002485 [Coemansia sp. RSA 485]|nr:hypothetical protein IWW45_002485 [Coemansia sp. RSA 485]